MVLHFFYCFLSLKLVICFTLADGQEQIMKMCWDVIHSLAAFLAISQSLVDLCAYLKQLIFLFPPLRSRPVPFDGGV